MAVEQTTADEEAVEGVVWDEQAREDHDWLVERAKAFTQANNQAFAIVVDIFDNWDDDADSRNIARLYPDAKTPKAAVVAALEADGVEFPETSVRRFQQMTKAAQNRATLLDGGYEGATEMSERALAAIPASTGADQMVETVEGIDTSVPNSSDIADAFSTGSTGGSVSKAQGFHDWLMRNGSDLKAVDIKMVVEAIGEYTKAKPEQVQKAFDAGYKKRR